MEKIAGIAIRKLTIKLEKMGDLLAYEGPILSHFISDNNEDFLFYWVESDDTHNRWLVYKTNNYLLRNFLQAQMNHRDLLQSAVDGFVYVIDINDELDYEHIIITPIENIPLNYFPPKDSFYESLHYEDYAANLKTYLELNLLRIGKFDKQKNESTIVLAMEPESPIYKKSKKKN